jgi:GlpG protein
MRLLARFENELQAKKLVRVLSREEIDSHLEIDESHFDVWVLNEDDLPRARELYALLSSGADLPEKELIGNERQEDEFFKKPQNVYYSPITRFFVFICTILFLASTYQQIQFKPVKDPLFPRFTQIVRNLLYDFPIAFAIADELMEKYELTKTSKLSELPEEGKRLIRQLEKNTPWVGFYNLILQDGESKQFSAYALFKDLKKGDFWRVFTPTFLHIELLHLLFNLLWLWMLGKMMEKNLKPLSYVLFILLASAFTNTLQYLATGPLFMGFSGVVAAQAGFIWVRKKVAPWEMYPVDKNALVFLWVFIFGMLALQIVAFFLEMFHIVSFQMNLANTAHVSGVVFGMILGRWNVFQRKL